MTVRNGVAFSLVFLALTSLLFACHANVQPGVNINPFCVRALDKAFCSEVVKPADTWQEAITEILSKTIMQVKMAEPIMANLVTTLPSTLDAKFKDNIELACRKAYEDVLDFLKEVEEALKTGDKTKIANLKLSSANTRLEDCADEFSKTQMPAEFASFYEGSKKLLRTCLSVERTRPDII